MKSMLVDKLKLNGAGLVCKTLKEMGVEVVFGIPGVHNLSLFEMLRRTGIRIVAPTHEQGAAFMANGYSRSTGKIGVFVTIPGPGLTNALTGIAEAYVDSTPVLGIVTALPEGRKSYQIHEFDQTSLLKPVSKTLVSVKSASEIPFELESLWTIATTGEPGPVILQIPAHLYWEKGSHQPIKDRKPKTQGISIQSPIDQVVSRIAAANQIGFFVGAGMSHASREILELAEWLNAPVATTQTGRGIIDEAHPLSLGFGWLNDSVEFVNQIMDKCDLVVAIGTKFSQTGTQDYRLRITNPLIHVDAASQVIGQNYEAEIKLPLDSGEFVRTLLEQKEKLRHRKDKGFLELIQKKREESLQRCKSNISTQIYFGDNSLNAFDFFQLIQTLVPKNTIVVTDSGYNERLTVQNWIVYEKYTLLNPSDYEAMGFGVPAAIGAAIANPKREVIAVIGDGGLAMSGLEILTVVRQNLNVKILVLNNNGFGVIKHIQKEMFGASIAVDHAPPDYESLAKSAHLPFYTTAGGVETVTQFFKQPGPGMMVINMLHRETRFIDQLKQRLKNDIKQGIQEILDD